MPIEKSVEAAAPGIFDLSSANGVNDSERFLMRLCRKSFLSLWAHANLHTAQDMRNGKGTFVAFGIDHPIRDYELSSEDVIVFTCHEYTPEERAEAEYFQRETGILGDGLSMKEGYATEFPVINSTQSRQGSEKGKRPDSLRRQKKHKARLAKATRRKNRR